MAVTERLCPGYACGMPLLDIEGEYCGHCAALMEAIALLREAEQTPAVTAFLRRVSPAPREERSGE